LHPRSGDAQPVVAERYEIAPWVPGSEYVDPFGNLCPRLPCRQATARSRRRPGPEERARQNVKGGAPGYPQAERINDWIRDKPRLPLRG
jgi:hypothetical protein